MVKTVIIINREDHNTQDRIIGSDLKVGDYSQPNLNTACGENPRSSGVYSCGGKIGRYLGLVKPGYEILNIS